MSKYKIISIILIAVFALSGCAIKDKVLSIIGIERGGSIDDSNGGVVTTFPGLLGAQEQEEVMLESDHLSISLNSIYVDENGFLIIEGKAHMPVCQYGKVAIFDKDLEELAVQYMLYTKEDGIVFSEREHAPVEESTEPEEFAGNEEELSEQTDSEDITEEELAEEDEQIEQESSTLEDEWVDFVVSIEIPEGAAIIEIAATDETYAEKIDYLQIPILDESQEALGIGEVTKVILKTNMGDIELELYPDAAPQTVSNFITLIRSDFYDGVTFHRVIEDFMIQSGDPLSKDDDPGNDGTGGPGYLFDDEINDYKVVRGALAMANSGPNTNGSQFFIVTTEAADWLDGKHTVFGNVISGMDVVDAISQVDSDENDRPLNDVIIEDIMIELQ